MLSDLISNNHPWQQQKSYHHLLRVSSKINDRIFDLIIYRSSVLINRNNKASPYISNDVNKSFQFRALLSDLRNRV